MHTLTLKIEDGIYEKFSWLLTHFSNTEVEILDKAEYVSDDEYLKAIKGMEQSILTAANEPIEKYVTADKLDW